MKRFSLLTVFAIIASSLSLQAQSTIDAQKVFKKHVNKIVQNVEKAETAQEKRVVLDESLDKIITAIEKVEKTASLSEKEQKGLNSFKNNIQEKKDELNGINGFKKVPNNSLNNFANFVQQDLEQADTITISVTTLLLIIIILILL